MPTIGQSYSNVRAVTQGVTNPNTPPAQVMVLSDGEGNIVGPSSSNGSQTFITYLSAAQAAPNTGTSFSTVGVTALAVDLTVTAFTGGTSPSVTFFVDRLAADGLWYRMWTSTGITAAGSTSSNIGPGQAGTGNVAAVLTGTARFGWSFIGTPTSVTFSASVIGRP